MNVINSLYQTNQIKQRDQKFPGELIVKTTKKGFYLMTIEEHKAKLADIALKDAYDQLVLVLEPLCARAKRAGWDVDFEQTKTSCKVSYDVGQGPVEKAFIYDCTGSMIEMHGTIKTIDGFTMEEVLA